MKFPFCSPLIEPPRREREGKGTRRDQKAKGWPLDNFMSTSTVHTQVPLPSRHDDRLYVRYYVGTCATLGKTPGIYTHMCTSSQKSTKEISRYTDDRAMVFFFFLWSLLNSRSRRTTEIDSPPSDSHGKISIISCTAYRKLYEEEVCEKSIYFFPRYFLFPNLFCLLYR